ncbi:hydantoinase B/oxoprolinase family protein [Acuticoccus kandeliae]|uniref:hydantoinase B/oxoprolinase family protein n=1 Tax=Acuticoccus kandeliae TaxID=2073160 RepID=UPI00196AE3EB|nr:hydantoinase B/oxoprolinase family protein [Acuticoccus kandeliae]
MSEAITMMQAAKAGGALTPVLIEIIRNAVRGIAERTTGRMIRASTSFIVKEMEDCSAAVFDREGRLLAESANIPIHLNCVGVCLKSILANHIPVEDWAEGDIVGTNDTYSHETSLASAHTNDYILFTPVFVAGELVGFVGLMVHHLDIGAATPGTRGWNLHIFHEGLRCPPVKLARRGVTDEGILAVILNNTRLPETMENDLKAQMASILAGAAEMRDLFSRYGVATVDAGLAALIAQSETRTRMVIEEIPDGTYRHTERILDDGAKGGPYTLKVAITVKGSSILFDFTGTDPQIDGPINSPLSATWAAIFYVMRCITDPEVPSNEGCKTPIDVIAPPGSLVNAQRPAAVFQRMVTCHTIVDLVMGALAEVIPDRVVADSCGCIYNFIASEPREGGGRISMFGEAMPGGLGATAKADGANVMSCHVTNAPLPPIEAIEAENPVLYLRREIQVDSGGAGRMRGGNGQVLTYRVLGRKAQLAHTSQKTVTHPQGIAGGLAGQGGRWIVNEGLPGERVLDHAIGDYEPIATGDTVTHYTASGGGFGDPLTRAPDAVVEDVRLGFLSRQKAREVYGLVVADDLSGAAPTAARSTLTAETAA